MPGRVDEKIRCSFCGKTQDQVRKLIAGNNNVFICDECIDLCSEILEEELPEEEDSGAEGESGPAQPERSSRRRIPAARKRHILFIAGHFPSSETVRCF